jgi:hypothetical protein
MRFQPVEREVQVICACTPNRHSTWGWVSSVLAQWGTVENLCGKIGPREKEMRVKTVPKCNTNSRWKKTTRAAEANPSASVQPGRAAFGGSLTASRLTNANGRIARARTERAADESALTSRLVRVRRFTDGISVRFAPPSQCA